MLLPQPVHQHDKIQRRHYARYNCSNSRNSSIAIQPTNTPHLRWLRPCLLVVVAGLTTPPAPQQPACALPQA